MATADKKESSLQRDTTTPPTQSLNPTKLSTAEGNTGGKDGALVGGDKNLPAPQLQVTNSAKSKKEKDLQYLQEHRICQKLELIVKQLLRDRPADPTIAICNMLRETNPNNPVRLSQHGTLQLPPQQIAPEETETPPYNSPVGGEGGFPSVKFQTTHPPQREQQLSSQQHPTVSGGQQHLPSSPDSWTVSPQNATRQVSSAQSHPTPTTLHQERNSVQSDQRPIGAIENNRITPGMNTGFISAGGGGVFRTGSAPASHLHYGNNNSGGSGGSTSYNPNAANFPNPSILANTMNSSANANGGSQTSGGGGFNTSYAGINRPISSASVASSVIRGKGTGGRGTTPGSSSNQAAAPRSTIERDESARSDVSVFSINSVDMYEFLAEFRSAHYALYGHQKDTITRANLGEIVDRVALPIPDTRMLADLFNEIDTSGAGSVPFEVFLARMAHRIQGKYHLEVIKGLFYSILANDPEGGQQGGGNMQSLTSASANATPAATDEPPGQLPPSSQKVSSATPTPRQAVSPPQDPIIQRGAVKNSPTIVPQPPPILNTANNNNGNGKEGKMLTGLGDFSHASHDSLAALANAGYMAGWEQLAAEQALHQGGGVSKIQCLEEGLRKGLGLTVSTTEFNNVITTLGIPNADESIVLNLNDFVRVVLAVTGQMGFEEDML